MVYVRDLEIVSIFSLVVISCQADYKQSKIL